MEPLTEPHPIFSTIEYVCILWFVFEYVLKLSVSYDRKKTFLKLLNIIDLLAILPFLIEFAFILVGASTAEMQDWKVYYQLLFFFIATLSSQNFPKIILIVEYTLGNMYRS